LFNPIEEDKGGWAFGAYGRIQKFIRGFGGET
jgi:hypothetical protein